jgi:hypothetical protein
LVSSSLNILLQGVPDRNDSNPAKTVVTILGYQNPYLEGKGALFSVVGTTAAKLKGIVSRKFAMLLLVPLES